MTEWKGTRGRVCVCWGASTSPAGSDCWGMGARPQLGCAGVVLLGQERDTDVRRGGSRLLLALLTTLKRERVLCTVAWRTVAGSPGAVPCTSERGPRLLSPNHSRHQLACKACLVGERLTQVPGAKCAQSLKHRLVLLGWGLESSAPSLRSSSLCYSAKEAELFLAGAEPQLSSFLCSPKTS